MPCDDEKPCHRWTDVDCWRCNKECRRSTSELAAKHKKVSVLGAPRRKMLSKLLQSDNGYALSFGNKCDDETYTIVGEFNWTEHLDRTTGGCCAEAEFQRCDLSEFANLWDTRVRIAGLDGAASNDRAETAVIMYTGNTSALERTFGATPPPKRKIRPNRLRKKTFEKLIGGQTYFVLRVN